MKSIRSTVGMVIAIAGAVVLGLALLPSGASAHYWYVYATCDKGLDVQLSWYEGTGNTVDIWIDEQPRVSTTFNASYSVIESFGDLSKAHTYRVKVVELGNAEGTFDTGTQPFAVCEQGSSTTQQGGGGGSSSTTATTEQGGGGGGSSSTTATTQQGSGGGGGSTSSTLVSSGGGSAGSSGGTTGSLPVTGGDAGMLVAVGVVLLATGVTTTVLARRRPV